MRILLSNVAAFTPRMRHVCARLEFGDLLDSPLQRGVFSCIIIDSLAKTSHSCFIAVFRSINYNRRLARLCTCAVFGETGNGTASGFSDSKEPEMAGKLKKLTPAKIDEAIELYNSGLSVQAVAEHFGITRQAMWPHLNKRVIMRPRERYGQDNPFYRGGITEDDHAQNLVEQAIQDKKISRPDRCQNCGNGGIFRDGRTSIQAHHCDYNKPLEVMWLCQKCHHEWHKHNTAIRKTS